MQHVKCIACLAILWIPGQVRTRYHWFGVPRQDDGVVRPELFSDILATLDTAILVFCQKGYDSTSVEDLTAALGITRPSLYAAFGNKESLFRKVLERYLAGPSAYFGAALMKTTARQAA